MNKHVESLPKVDKSITFHYCTVICDILRPFLQRQHKLYLIFLRFKFFLKWANLRLSVNVQKPKVFQLQGGFAPDPLTRSSAPGPRWRLRPQTPNYRGLTLVFGGLQHSNGIMPPLGSAEAYTG